jgi:hypothetical protein
MPVERNAYSRVGQSRADTSVEHSRSIQQAFHNFAFDRDSIAMRARDMHSEEFVEWDIVQNSARLVDVQFTSAH